tara:strand:- start:145 stop:531 length:387 start_codon:yes stop_codon:yes gene_type:complete
MTDNYETDIWLANLFRGWNDPCPLGGLEDGKDGLVESWKINTFVNPPYSNIMPWVQKAIYECEQNKIQVVMLLKMDTSTMWFATLKQAGAQFLWINRRLKHRTNSGASFASMLAVLTPSEDTKQTRFK